jgi:hypothetical protein
MALLHVPVAPTEPTLELLRSLSEQHRGQRRDDQDYPAFTMTPEDRTPATRDERPDSGGEMEQREARMREREARRSGRPQGMVPGRERRRTGIERGAMRAVATGGIVGIGVVLGAVLVGQDLAGWIVGLVVSVVSILLAALLWSSRQL